ncbi:hypothetical protein INR49_016445, partial [Caranx melampygus]
MNLSAEAVPCLSEVSASDKRWGRPPPVTDRPASWRLRPQSNHATRKGPALCSWSVTLRAGGAARGRVEGSVVCVGGIKAQSKTEKRRKNETRMEKRRDRGVEGQKEQVVRREGLMSNERFTRPQLILSLYLCFGASLSTK